MVGFDYVFVLNVLGDGEWHSVNEIMHKTESVLKLNQMCRILKVLKFLEKYGFVQRTRRSSVEFRLAPDVKEFLMEMENIGKLLFEPKE